MSKPSYPVAQIRAKKNFRSKRVYGHWYTRQYGMDLPNHRCYCVYIEIPNEVQIREWPTDEYRLMYIYDPETKNWYQNKQYDENQQFNPYPTDPSIFKELSIIEMAWLKAFGFMGMMERKINRESIRWQGTVTGRWSNEVGDCLSIGSIV